MNVTRSQPRLRLLGWVCASCQVRQSWSASPRRSYSITSTRLSTASRKAKLPDGPARTRFAPSPTGNLHLGSIRTALFNYLIARRTGGQFLLRLEDTDQKRTVPGAEERLYEDLKWAGLQWDEGPVVGGPYGPYRQSERLSVYHKYVQTLLETGKAYRCYCSTERIDTLNRMRHDKGLPLGYDRKCIDEQPSGKTNHHSHVIRFRVPAKYPRYIDLVYGKTGHGQDRGKQHQFDEPVYDDPILIKSDGFPTYHFANIIDDHLMKITHVVRGSEWMSSTPLHLALYEAYDWTPPLYGHVPLLVDHNRQKLSKRNFDSDISSFRRKGVFPETLVNFTALLGWSHQQKSDVMDLPELEAMFDLKFTKGNTIVSFDKLTFLQTQHAKRRVAAAGEDFEQMIRDVAVVLLEKHGAGVIAKFIGKRKLRDVVAMMLQAESMPYSSATDFAEQCSLFLDDSTVQRRPALKVSRHPELLRSFRTAAATLCLVPENDWNAEVHRANLAQLQIVLPSTSDVDMKENLQDAQRQGKKELYHYLRWALLGNYVGPSIAEIMQILGKETCSERIRDAALLTKIIETGGTRPNVRVPKGVGAGAWKQHSMSPSTTTPSSG